jgi:hypothetical protein
VPAPRKAGGEESPAPRKTRRGGPDDAGREQGTRDGMGLREQRLTIGGCAMLARQLGPGRPVRVPEVHALGVRGSDALTHDPCLNRTSPLCSRRTLGPWTARATATWGLTGGEPGFGLWPVDEGRRPVTGSPALGQPARPDADEVLWPTEPMKESTNGATLLSDRLTTAGLAKPGAPSRRLHLGGLLSVG